MSMVTISNRVANSLTKELEDALVYFSDKKITKEKANFMAKKTMESVNFDNPTLSHKGINWLAKEILKKIK